MAKVSSFAENAVHRTAPCISDVSSVTSAGPTVSRLAERRLNECEILRW